MIIGNQYKKFHINFKNAYLNECCKLNAKASKQYATKFAHNVEKPRLPDVADRFWST